MNDDIIDQLVAEAAEVPVVRELMEAARHGHLCMKGEAKGMRVLEGGEEWFEEPVGQWGDLLYLQRCWVMESRIVAELRRLMVDVKPLDMVDVRDLNGKQQEAVKKGLRCSVFCLSGGPGTGKTHTVAELVRQHGGEVIVTAPTGKAVAQLKERISGVQAGTLHALLGIRSLADVMWGEGQLDADMVVVDECSMIDVGMWGALLRGIKEGTRLILVGDYHQLPPVEVGTIYGEICLWMRQEQCTHLDECMRSDRVEILEMAEKVKSGGVIDGRLLKEVDMGRWVRLFQRGDFRILSSMREGSYGVDAINREMMRLFRQEYEGGEWKIPVMATETNYEQGVFNGEMGVLIKQSISDQLEAEDVLCFGEKKIPAVLLPGFELAYAISVHKSQGSEYDHVALVMPPGSEVFGREVLYTGITRARMSLEVYGEVETLKLCAARSAQKLSGIRKKLERIEKE